MDELYSICSYFYKNISKIVAENGFDFIKISPTSTGLKINIDSEELCVIKVEDTFVKLESKMKVVDGILCNCSVIESNFSFTINTIKDVLESVLDSVRELINTVPKEMD